MVEESKGACDQHPETSQNTNNSKRRINLMGLRKARLPVIDIQKQVKTLKKASVILI